MKEKCKLAAVDFDNGDKKYFYGMFDVLTDNFRFMDGDIDLINEILTHIKTKLKEVGHTYFKTENQRKVSMIDTFQFPIGHFFARKEKTIDVAVSKIGGHSMNEEDIRKDLFERKLLPILSSASSLKAVRPITIDIVKIVKNNEKIHADVICVFCTDGQNIMVQCTPSNTNVCYWNPANFKKHINHHKQSIEMKNVKQLKDGTGHSKSKKDKNKPAKPVKKQNDSMNSTISEDEEENAVDMLKKVTCRELEQKKKRQVRIDSRKRKSSLANSDNIDSKILRKQMSDQNLYTLSKVLENNEKTEEMGFELDGGTRTIKVAEIAQDGSCFFGSVAHQIYGCKLDSSEHQHKTAELRNKVVKHMQSNFDKYRYLLQGRVYECRGKVPKENLESECHIFLNACLSVPKTYAGSESFKAISEIEEVNIITFSENGTCYLAVDFVEDFKRTIFLAHRLSDKFASTSHNVSRNHYDSVVEIENEVLFKVSNFLNEIIKKKTDFHLNNNSSIMSINTSIESVKE